MFNFDKVYDLLTINVIFPLPLDNMKEYGSFKLSSRGKGTMTFIDSKSYTLSNLNLKFTIKYVTVVFGDLVWKLERSCGVFQPSCCSEFYPGCDCVSALEL